MASELLVTGSLVIDTSEIAGLAIQAPEYFVNQTAKNYVHDVITVGTTERAIPLGDVAAPGWSLFKNVGSVGSVSLRVGTAGAVFAIMGPGEHAGPFRLGGNAQTPYAIASAAGARLQYMICDT